MTKANSPRAQRPKNVPRGIRNCNPLNIRIGNTWFGERKDPDDTEFEQFVNMECGIRAAFCILRRYIRRYHLNTIRLIISRWAPDNENNTASYIQHVSSLMGIDADAPILYEDKPTMCNLVYAMAIVENGQPVLLSQVEKGYDLT